MAAGIFKLPGTDVWVVYGMQKTCADSGREFYALGRYEPEIGRFTLLDASSDLGNNVFDGGEGYAHMQVLDPRGGGPGRILWTGAVIEGDRDPRCALTRSTLPPPPIAFSSRLWSVGAA